MLIVCWVGPATAEQASNLHAESRYEAYLDIYLSLQDKKGVSFLYFLRLEPGPGLSSWSHCRAEFLCCSSDDEVSKASMVDGRGNGRLARRRKRLEKLRAKEAVAREERQVRKELVKVPGPVASL